MDYINHPLITYLKYWIYRYIPSYLVFVTIPLLILGLLIEHWVVPHHLRIEFSYPVSYVYMRSDAPGVQIAIRTPDVNKGGLSDLQNTIIQDVLNKVPASHLKGIGMIGAEPRLFFRGSEEGGVFDLAGIISLGITENSDPLSFQQSLLHELGHMVENNSLHSKQLSEWKYLHRGSSDPHDFVTPYAQTGDDYPDGAGDDFAETYMTWVTGTDQFAMNAINAVTQGHTFLLQKFLFMSTLFANLDGTMNFYSNVEVNGTSTTTISAPILTVEKRPYYRTANALTIGNYTFALKGNIITTILSGPGVIAGNLTIPVPQYLLDKLKMTDPAPGASQTSPASVWVAPGSYIPALRMRGTPWGTPGLEIISSNRPTHYVPLMSDAGYTALASEQALISNPKKLPGISDVIRPHGDFAIIPSGRE
jgi:hypothetical protein